MTQKLTKKENKTVITLRDKAINQSKHIAAV